MVRAVRIQTIRARSLPRSRRRCGGRLKANAELMTQKEVLNFSWLCVLKTRFGSTARAN